MQYPLRMLRLTSLVAAGGLVLCARTTRADTFHVDPAGDDGADGSAGTPWRTLQHAADQVGAGDTVMVAAGSYAGMYLEASGTEAAPLAFVAAPGVVVSGDNEVTDDGLNLEGSAWVTIEGFEVTGATRAGIRTVLGEHVTLRGNHIHDNGRWGVLTGFSDDLLIERNEVSGSVDEHGVYVANSGDRPVVRGNVLWGNAAAGLHMNGDLSNGGDGVISDAIVEGNTLFGNGAAGGGAINCDGVTGSVFSNNLIYDNLSVGIALYQIDGGAPSNGNLVINNTIVMPDGSRWGVVLHDGATNTTLRNNIIRHENDVRGAVEACDTCLVGLVADHNAVTPRFAIGEEIIDLAAWTAATGQDGDALDADAGLFRDRAGGDFQLAAGAAAIDAGSADGAPGVDLAGNGRPQGAGVDLGAFEDCGAAACLPPVCIGDACTGGDGGDGEGDDAVDDGGCHVGAGGDPAVGLLVVVVGVALVRRRDRRLA